MPRHHLTLNSILHSFSHQTQHNTRRKLRCPRNSLHLHLFFSFMIRSSAYFIKSVFEVSFESEAHPTSNSTISSDLFKSTTLDPTQLSLHYSSDQNAFPFIIRERSVSCFFKDSYTSVALESKWSELSRNEMIELFICSQFTLSLSHSLVAFYPLFAYTALLLFRDFFSFLALSFVIPCKTPL